MSKFTVSRSAWLRGQGHEASSLLSEEGKRCCLGFVASQCEISDTDLLNKDAFNALAISLNERVPEWLRSFDQGGWYGHSSGAADAMEVNDMPDYTEDEREQRLKSIFEQHGDELIFIP